MQHAGLSVIGLLLTLYRRSGGRMSPAGPMTVWGSQAIDNSRKQGVALTRRNTTGPPLLTPGELHCICVTDDDDRHPRPLLVWPSYTMRRRASNKKTEEIDENTPTCPMKCSCILIRWRHNTVLCRWTVKCLGFTTIWKKISHVGCACTYVPSLTTPLYRVYEQGDPPLDFVKFRDISSTLHNNSYPQGPTALSVLIIKLAASNGKRNVAK